LPLLSRYRSAGAPPSLPTRRSSDLSCPRRSRLARALGRRAPVAVAHERSQHRLRLHEEGPPHTGDPGDEVTARALAVRLVVVASDRKSTRLNSSHVKISYAVFCLKK